LRPAESHLEADVRRDYVELCIALLEECFVESFALASRDTNIGECPAILVSLSLVENQRDTFTLKLLFGERAGLGTIGFDCTILT